MMSRGKRPLVGNAILLFAAIAPIWTLVYFPVDWPLALAPLFLSHVLLLYPTLTPQSQWWGPVMRSFAAGRREVWLTIDDGPSETDTRKILETLDRFGALATFFVIGDKAARAPELLADILARGHQIANHTFTHPSANFWCAFPKRIAREVDRCDSAIGRENPSRKFFRAPAGFKNFFLQSVLRKRGITLIGWTVRGFDTAGRSPQKVAARIIKHVRPGAIILLHEGHRAAAAADYNPNCVELVLRELAVRGYKFVIPSPEQLRPFVGGT